jgi:hypothetical protein
MHEDTKRGLLKWVKQDPDKIPDDSGGSSATGLDLILERSSVFVPHTFILDESFDVLEFSTLGSIEELFV